MTTRRVGYGAKGDLGSGRVRIQLYGTDDSLHRHELVTEHRLDFSV